MRIVAIFACLTLLFSPAYAADNYIINRSGSTWTQQAKLFPADGAIFDAFGWHVTMDGDTALLGAAFDDNGGFENGVVYVFICSGSAWVQQAKLTPSDSGILDWFGWTVSLRGDTAIITSHGDTDSGLGWGSAYVFKRSGSTWMQQAKLTPTDSTIFDELEPYLEKDTRNGSSSIECNN